MKLIKKIYGQLVNLTVGWKVNTPSTGYSILLTLPADLRCMAYLSLEFLKEQNLEHCKEILVCLDSAEDRVSSLVKPDSLKTPMRIISINPLLNFVNKFLKSPFKFHASQIVTGINKSKTNWIVLKGCNYYLENKNFYEFFYNSYKDSRAIIFGSEERFHDNKSHRFAGTFEAAIHMDIKKISKPYDIFAKTMDDVDYDNMLYMQLDIVQKNGSRAIQLLPEVPPKKHLYFAIGGYRTALQSKNDHWLRVFFMVVMNELLRETNWYDPKIVSADDYFEIYSQVLHESYVDKYLQLFDMMEWIIQKRKLNYDLYLTYKHKLIKRIKDQNT